MSKKIQLVIDGVPLPPTSNDRYSCYEEDLKERIEMISGRVVEELRGKVQRIVYSYDTMDDATCRAVLAALRRRGAKTVAYLPDDSDDLTVSTFLVESLTPPAVLCFDGGKPVWHNLAFTLREVKPHA